MHNQNFLGKSTSRGFSCIALSVFAFSADAASLVINGSFESPFTTTGGNFVGSIPCGVLTRCITMQGWDTTSSLSVLISPSNVVTYLDPAVVPKTASGGSNFLGVDSAFGLGTLYQTMTGLVNGQIYTLSFDQSSAQLNGNYGNTIDQWIVTVGGVLGATSVNIPLPTNSTVPVSNGPLSGRIITGWDNQWTTPLIDNASGQYTPWTHHTYTFTANCSGIGPCSKLLGFLAVGAPAGIPPFALLDSVSVDAVPEPGTFALLAIGLVVMLKVRQQKRIERDFSFVAIDWRSD